MKYVYAVIIGILLPTILAPLYMTFTMKSDEDCMRVYVERSIET